MKREGIDLEKERKKERKVNGTVGGGRRGVLQLLFSFYVLTLSPSTRIFRPRK